MLSFQCDYSKGALNEILQRLITINMESNVGYGMDDYCSLAKEKIKTACNCPDADVHFLTGGTQTNQVVISTMLRSYEGVIAASTGHINCHEAGAIEYSGHKVLSIPHENGKLSADKIKDYLEIFYADESHAHMVHPGMVYISHPTEYGTLYSLEELSAISDICHNYQIPLFLDGARLGYGLVCKDTDVTMEDIARLCDVFYIGGTKVGALFGEAVVFTKNNTPKGFYTMTKQHGAMLAKGWLLGVQFDTLFTDDLYFKASRQAIAMSDRLRNILREKEYRFFIESPTNQIFVIMENTKIEELRKNVNFEFWEKYDDSHTVMRFATSWATTETDVDELEKLL